MMDMFRPAVPSSHIASVGYDENSRTMAVQFHGGQVYHYSGVSPEIYSGLRTADSAGDFFHSKIKGRFDHRRVK